MGQLGIDRESRVASRAYKLDEAAAWRQWWDEVGLSFTQVTGPDAPHWFRFCALRDLGAHDREETEQTLTSVTGLPPPCPDDIVMVVKAHMADPKVLQVVRVLSAADRSQAWLVQPQGLHHRRLGGEDVKAKVAKVAKDLHAAGALRAAARDYLVGWAEGTRRRERRPATYGFLQHRWQRAVLAPPLPRPPAARPPRLVLVRSVHGPPLPQPPPDEPDEAEPGPLAIMP